MPPRENLNFLKVLFLAFWKDVGIITNVAGVTAQFEGIFW